MHSLATVQGRDVTSFHVVFSSVSDWQTRSAPSQQKHRWLAPFSTPCLISSFLPRRSDVSVTSQHDGWWQRPAFVRFSSSFPAHVGFIFLFRFLFSFLSFDCREVDIDVIVCRKIFNSKHRCTKSYYIYYPLLNSRPELALPQLNSCNRWYCFNEKDDRKITTNSRERKNSARQMFRWF